MTASNWVTEVNERHHHDPWYDGVHCERLGRDDTTLCHCHKRWRERNGVTTIPTDDLEFPPPLCTSCSQEVWHDGDGWRCDDCALGWSSNGVVDTAMGFTDIYGDERPCAAHDRPFCWHCGREEGA